SYDEGQRSAPDHGSYRGVQRWRNRDHHYHHGAGIAAAGEYLQHAFADGHRGIHQPQGAELPAELHGRRHSARESPCDHSPGPHATTGLYWWNAHLLFWTSL